MNLNLINYSIRFVIFVPLPDKNLGSALHIRTLFEKVNSIFAFPIQIRENSPYKISRLQKKKKKKKNASNLIHSFKFICQVLLSSILK